MIKKNIIKKYETFLLHSNKINNNKSSNGSKDSKDSKELNTTSLLYSMCIDSNASSLCESLLCDEDRRIMNDINIDDIMEIILYNNDNNNHDDDEDNVYERLKIAYNNG